MTTKSEMVSTRNLLPLSRLTLLAMTALLMGGGQVGCVGANVNYIQCGECDVDRCPELHYCEGHPIKDNCGCCTVCSDDKYQPHLMIAQQPAAVGNACDQVKCPKLKVCVENMQGLPLCTCPALFVCRRTKKREVCGSDGQTYESRCHMRIASCNQGVIVRKKYRGPCSSEDEEKDGESYRRRIKKMKKRRRRRRRRKDKLAAGGGDEKDEEKKRGRKRRKEERRRKRRKSGKAGRGKKRVKSRTRRHRNKNTFEEAFAHYSWQA